MKVSSIPENESERLEALRGDRVPKTETEPDHNTLVELASEIYDTPIAIITLVGENRQWIKSRIVLDAEEESRLVAFCSYANHENDVMVVSDILKDKRFSDDQLVTKNPKIRFYAGITIITSNGSKLGTLSVMDNKPRHLSDDQLKTLQILGRQVVNLLDLRQRNFELKKENQEKTAELTHFFEQTTDAFLAIDRNWRFTYVNQRVGEMAKRSPESLIGKNVWEEFPVSIDSAIYQAYHQAMSEHRHVSLVDHYAPLDNWTEYQIYPSKKGISVFIKEITMTKRAEQRLIQNIETLERAEEQANLGSWHLDVGSGKWHWSTQLYRLSGLDPANGIPTLEQNLGHVHPEDRQMIKEGFEKMRQGLEPELGIYRTNPELLPLRYLQPKIRCVRDTSGRPITFEGIVIDITERKKGEHKLAESENRLRAIIQTEPECVKLVGAKCELLEMNPAGLSMIEAESIDQVLGHSLLGLVAPEYRESFADLVKRIFEGMAGTLEFKMVSLKGTTCWIETHAVPLRDNSGNITSMLGVSRDITNNRIAIESLRQAEERYRSIFENSIDGIFQSTPEGRFFTANSALAHIFGYPSAQVLIDSITDIGAELYADPEERHRVKELLEKNGEVIAEYKAIKKNNDIIWVQTSTRCVYDDRGGVKYFEGTLKDITEQKLAELKLKSQFEELQKTNHELDRFVYSVSHDLRAPIATVLGVLNVAEMEAPTEALKSYCNMIRTSINRLDGFINDILDYSQNSRRELKVEEVDFRKLIDECIESQELIAGKERLKIETKIVGTGRFYSDPLRLGIIMNNLLSNAIKYQDYQKDNSYASIQVNISHESAHIYFADNGVGIERKHLPRIFEMFYRASPNSKGSGLGLYIAKETATKLNGRISVRSEFGQSTTFEVTIPNSPPAK